MNIYKPWKWQWKPEFFYGVAWNGRKYVNLWCWHIQWGKATVMPDMAIEVVI